MENPTRRLDTPDNQDGGPTRRLPDKSRPTCLHCGAGMVPTTALIWASPNPLVLIMRGAKSKFRAPVQTTGVDTMTCADCGYTELYAHDLEQLATMIEAYERDPESN